VTTANDTLTPEQARKALATAKQEKREADGLADALAEQVRAGATDVTPKKLADARQLAEFAELRITAAERKIADAEEADRHARAEQAAAEARDIATDDDLSELAPHVQAVVDAIASLVAVAEARDSRIRRVGNSLRLLGHELASLDPTTNLVMRARYGVEGDAQKITVYDPPIKVESIRPAHLVAAAVGIGTGRTHYAELREAFEVIEFMVPRVCEQVPALAEITRPNPDASA
jgi:chromosome segregation ATPase